MMLLKYVPNVVEIRDGWKLFAATLGTYVSQQDHD
jgi:hypothetical protein